MTKNLKSAFYSQRFRAKKRNINWDLTFKEWLDIWLSSGKLHLRGKGKHNFCMCRYNDIGDYTKSNVYIDNFSNNNKLQHIWNPRTDTIIGNSQITVKTPLGTIENYSSLSTFARKKNFKYCTLWKNFNEKGSYKGYEKI